MDRRGLPPSVRRVKELVNAAYYDPSPAVSDTAGQPREGFELPVRLVRKTVYRELSGNGQYKAREDYLPAEDPESWDEDGVPPGMVLVCGCGCGDLPRFIVAGMESYEFDDGGRT